MVNLAAYVTEKDIQKWKIHGREDILLVLEHQHYVWQGDSLINPETGIKSESCPFLDYNMEEDLFYCTIHDDLPEVCVNFKPGSSEICPLFYKK